MLARARFSLSRALATLSRGRLVPRLHALPPFVGYLEERDGALRGWMLDSKDPILAVTARLDGGSEWRLRADLPRLDVEAVFGGRALGFSGPPVTTGSRLEIWVEQRTGAKRRAFVTSLAERDRSAGQEADRPLAAAFGETLRRVSGEEFPRLGAASSELGRDLARGPSALRAQLRRVLLEPAQCRSSPPAPEGRLRILVVAGTFPSMMHGGGLRLFDLLTELAQRHDLDLYSTFDERLDGPTLARLRPHLKTIHLVRSLDVKELAVWLGERSGSEYDVAHFEFPESAAAMEVVQGRAGRTVFTMMECRARARLIDLERALNGGGDVLSAARRFAEAVATEGRALLSCDVAVAVNDVDADFAARLYRRPRPEVIPTCLSPVVSGPLASAPEVNPEAVALFVGYYGHPPNVEALEWFLDAVHPMLAARVPSYRLRIVGAGSLGHLESRCRRDPRIELAGEVANFTDELLRARVGLAPIVSGAGIRGKVNQYAAAGRPTVSTRLGAAGLPYIHGESILIADAPGAFADAVERLLVDDTLWKAMARSARSLAIQHFSWPEAIARLEAAYRR